MGQASSCRCSRCRLEKRLWTWLYWNPCIRPKAGWPRKAAHGPR